jgi:formylmethanofuran dehydrogenase subunit A
MLRITGGRVYDPANGVDGVIKDICIADGRIVADVQAARTIDAFGPRRHDAHHLRHGVPLLGHGLDDGE